MFLVNLMVTVVLVRNLVAYYILTSLRSLMTTETIKLAVLFQNSI